MARACFSTRQLTFAMRLSAYSNHIQQSIKWLRMRQQSEQSAPHLSSQTALGTQRPRRPSTLFNKRQYSKRHTKF